LIEATPSVFVIDRSALDAEADRVISAGFGEHVPFPFPVHDTAGPLAVVNPLAEADGVKLAGPLPE
jgi:hypothetical protein